MFAVCVCVREREVRLFSSSNRMMMIILGSTVEGQGGGTFHLSSKATAAPTPESHENEGGMMTELVFSCQNVVISPHFTKDIITIFRL